jgi:dTMP kinase
VSKGLFVTLEGPDGAGKSTQGRLLRDALAATGREVVLTREPGGSPGAEEIRRLLVEGEPGRWSAMTEVLLFNAARRDHVEVTIRPALARGAVVICDRFVDSTRAYQSADRRADGAGVPDRAILDIHKMCIEELPDLTFILSIPPLDAAERASTRVGGEDRFERFGLSFQERVLAAFLTIAEAEPERCRVIDGTGAPEDVHARVMAALRDRLDA